MANYPRPAYFGGGLYPATASTAATGVGTTSQHQPTSTLALNRNTADQYASTNPYASLTPSSYNNQVNALSKQYSTYLQGDQTLQGQYEALRNQLQNQWTAGVVTPAQQAAVTYGAGLDQDKIQGLLAPKWQGTDVGASLAASLSDPSIAATAANNPYSTLAQITRNLNLKNNSDLAHVAGSGFANTGAVGQTIRDNSFDAGQQRAAASDQFLSTLSGLYNSYLGNLGQADQTRSGYTSDALDRATALINAGILSGNGGTAPQQTQTQAPRPTSPVRVGQTTSYEPKPTGANFYNPLTAKRPVAAPLAAVPAIPGSHSHFTKKPLY